MLSRSFKKLLVIAGVVIIAAGAFICLSNNNKNNEIANDNMCAGSINFDIYNEEDVICIVPQFPPSFKGNPMDMATYFIETEDGELIPVDYDHETGEYTIIEE